MNARWTVQVAEPASGDSPDRFYLSVPSEGLAGVAGGTPYRVDEPGGGVLAVVPAADGGLAFWRCDGCGEGAVCNGDGPHGWLRVGGWDRDGRTVPDRMFCQVECVTGEQ